MKKLFLLLVAAILVACAPGEIKIPQSPALRILEKKSGSIAYIGSDGNVYITDQGATNTTPLTTDVTQESRSNIAYNHLAWSQDGSQVAFVRLEKNGANSFTSELMVANVNDDSVKSIYTSETEFPFYINWSPDNKNVGMLTTTITPQILALQSVPIDGGDQLMLDTGSPFYWSWAPDGNSIIVHKNGISEERMSQLSFLKIDPEVTEYVMDEVPASFQAPAWSPDGNFILLTTFTPEEQQQIVLADSQGVVQKEIAHLELNTSFAWAADSQQYAYIVGTRQMQSGALGPLHVGNINGSEETVIDENVVGYFWSPNGKMIAYLVPSAYTSEDSTEEIFYFELYILDIASGESRMIASFEPTDEFFTLIPYMDQYHQSMTIWSPDSNNLVISFITSDGYPAIAVIPASGITEPRFLVEGVFAAWSWK